MDLFFSSLFSMLIRRLTPSITLCTNSTSEKPRRSELEMSNTLPTAAVSTPPKIKKKKTQLSVSDTDNLEDRFSIKKFDLERAKWMGDQSVKDRKTVRKKERKKERMNE